MAANGARKRALIAGAALGAVLMLALDAASARGGGQPGGGPSGGGRPGAAPQGGGHSGPVHSGGSHPGAGYPGVRHVNGGHVGVGVYFPAWSFYYPYGPSYWPGWPYYGAPYYGAPYYGYPYYAYPPAAVPVPSSPPTYVEQPRPAPGADGQRYWYWCGDPQGYYPTVRECPGGWTPVAPQPSSTQ